MPVSIDDLTVNIAHLDLDYLLEDWTWLIGKRKRPICVSAIGDAFLEDPATGAVHWLDVGQAQLHHLSKSRDGFGTRLENPEFIAMILQSGLITQLREAGVFLLTGQLYSFKQPPVMGGFYIVENFQPTEIATHFRLAGRFHRQVRGLPGMG